jgi:hypothetical protein
MTFFSLVTPTKVGVQLRGACKMKLDSGFRRNDDEEWDAYAGRRWRMAAVKVPSSR